MEKSTAFIIALLLVFLLVLTVLIVTRKKKENFKKCVCTSREEGREQACQDIDTVQKLYDNAVLTEYTDLKAPGWDRGANPGDYDFPKDKGCGWESNSKTKEWQSWDFTEFGN